MNSRERVLATIQHRPTDRTPLDCWLYQKQFLELLESDYGSREKFLDEFTIDLFTGFVPWPNQLGHKLDVTELEGVQLDDARDPFWLTYKAWTEDFAGANIQEAVEQQGQQRCIVAHIWGIVEGTSSFLGIENCWFNLGMQPELMTAWFDRYADWLCALADNLISAGVDLITLSDDWGSNRNMLFSPKLWRSMIAPYAGRVVQHIRGRGIPVNLHSDGYIMNILDDIVALGYTSIHPVQESAGMDPQTIKDKYGGKLVVYGALDVIDGLLAYEGEALDDYITKRFEIYAPGGGFIFNTGHFVQPDIPPQRLMRAYQLASELARKYGTA
jgi:uroporphyrinogen decarboxylase